MMRDETSLGLNGPRHLETGLGRPVYVQGGLTTDAFPDVGDFLNVWNMARGDRFAPRCSDIDLLAFPPRLVPLIYLVDVERNPLKFRYRFIGTRVCEFEGQDYTGHCVNELQPAAVGAAVQREFERYLDNPEPTFFAMLVDEQNFLPHVFSVYGGVRVPLSDGGGTVSQILGLAQFETDHKHLRKYYWEMVRRH
ncbi:MAG: PAS domain-containing protein [Rhodospirillales bacterium]